MHRRQAIQTLLGSAAAPGLLRAARRPGDKPNLLFLWTDQQRADTLAVSGNYGYHVPVMNRLAAESVVMSRCYDAQPVCTPARSAIMTGLWPHQTGATTNNTPLHRETKTLPELLADSAYRTAYMGKWHLGDEVYAQHGFERWVSIEDIYNEYFTPGRDAKKHSSYHEFLAGLGYKPDTDDGTFSRDFAVHRPLEHCKPAFLANEATRFIYENRREPWMLYVNFLEPHPPYYGPLNELHSRKEAPLPRNYPGTPVEREPAWYAKLRERQQKGIEKTTYSAAEMAGSKDRLATAYGGLNLNYAGNCSLVDQALGRILWALETSGQAGNTIVVFTSDHGEMGGSHCLLQKGVMYEEAMHVPMLLRIPFRQRSQIVVEGPVSHIDVVPSLLELLTGRQNHDLPGKSWIDLMSGEERAVRDVFLEWTDPDSGPHGRTIVTADGLKLAAYATDHWMLFDRARDPLEMNNLCYRAGHSSVVGALAKRIRAWQEHTGDKLALPDKPV